MKAFHLYKAIRRGILLVANLVDHSRCQIIFWGNGLIYENFKTQGIPFVSVAMGGTCIIGDNLSMNNGARGNPVGSFDRCTIFVDKDAKLIVGNNLGISQAALVCHKSITIGNNVKIGGGTCIYDTDFHALDHNLRANAKSDFSNKVKRPVIIGNNVFIGAHSIILKGVTIGVNSIIGAGSVLTKSVPPNQIWAGNPAKFIRNL